ncbi:MAG: IS1 family transposase [Acidobacteriia bacterium]|nr:IS1 family transposase [Terriglobia bacterium]MYG03299.1 IS1 family transposase [Terriglobia bacterium]MYK11160.1 IS1 family transposase [Terriglobia bacterium]
MQCKHCSGRCRDYGKNRSGTRRYQCVRCGRTQSEPRRSVGNMYLPFEKACRTAELLVEGCSVRSAARLSGLPRCTVLSLVAKAGGACRLLLRDRIRNVDVDHLELDEIWGFVYKKQRRVTAKDPDTVGDAYVFIAIERTTRLIVAWHLGKRDLSHTARFILAVRQATSAKRFQISTDGYPEYELAIEAGLSDRASYGRIVKVTNPGRVEPVFGNPDVSQIETTYIERFNGTLRGWLRRFSRKTYAFSKDWDMLEAALALLFASYNFCKVHTTLRKTPAMAAGLADHPWSMDELLEKACS